jgi:3-oxoacyl-[acyl-carrier protein] reductase
MIKGKNAIIYGAGGSLAGAIASMFASQGANLFLTGRTIASLEKIKKEILEMGGSVDIAEVDAMDQKAVNDHIELIAQKAGSIDISFNLIGWKDTQNIALVDMNLDDFIRPISIAMTSHFITATAAAKQMMKQRSGVILSLTATPGGIGYPHVGGFGPACCSVESFSRDLASELGPYGVRVVNIRSAGSPDSKVFKDAIDTGGQEVREFIQKMADDTMLKQLPLMADIANTAVFLASDFAGKITGVTLDVTAGTTSALNYKIPYIPFGERYVVSKDKDA